MKRWVRSLVSFGFRMDIMIPDGTSKAALVALAVAGYIAKGIAVVVAGLMAYGVYSFARARLARP